MADGDEQVLRSSAKTWSRGLWWFMDVRAVDDILRFALARSACEDWDNRGLGAIHLLKLVYLADLAHARRNDGRTYTGASWRFHHFGPWAEGVFERVKAVTSGPDVARRVFSSSRFAEDAERFTLEADEVEPVIDVLDRRLPWEITSIVKRAVHEHGSMTEGLLHEVYRTPPMLNAAPSDRLDFETAVAAPLRENPAPSEKLSRKREKKLEAHAADVRRRLAQSLAARKAAAVRRPVTTPRYDEVFDEGTRFLDELAGAPLSDGTGEADVDNSVWKSDARTRGDLP